MAAHGFTGIFFVPSGQIERDDISIPTLDRPMSWAQLSELVAAGHEVGAHSVSHQQLTRIPAAQMEREVRECKTVLEDHLQRSVEFFCYPSGDYNQTVKTVVKAARYEGACTVEPGANRPGDDVYALRRTEISGLDSLRDFEKKLAGAYDCMHAVVQAIGKLKSP